MVIGTSSPQTLEALAAAGLFAAVFRYGWRLHRPGMVSRRGLLSFAAGISVAYVFVHVLPALSRGKEIQVRSAATFPLLFPEYSVYIWAMAGFLVFYGLERLNTRSRERAAGEAAGREGARYASGAGSFTAYVWLPSSSRAASSKWLGVSVSTP